MATPEVGAVPDLSGIKDGYEYGFHDPEHYAFKSGKGLDRRIVEDGRVVTAGGVASSLDLGLYLVEKYWGAAARETIAAQQEYTAYRVR